MQGLLSRRYPTLQEATCSCSAATPNCQASLQPGGPEQNGRCPHCCCLSRRHLNEQISISRRPSADLEALGGGAAVADLQVFEVGHLQLGLCSFLPFPSSTFKLPATNSPPP